MAMSTASPVPPYAPSPQTGGPGFVEDWDRTMDTTHHDVSPATTNMAKKDSVGVGSPLVYHPDIVSAGMEAIYDSNEGKEVVPPQPPQQYAHYQDGEKYPAYPNQRPEKNKRRICGLTIPIIFVLIILLIIALAVGLGVGLGVGLKNKYVRKETVELRH